MSPQKIDAAATLNLNGGVLATDGIIGLRRQPLPGKHICTMAVELASAISYDQITVGGLLTTTER